MLKGIRVHKIKKPLIDKDLLYIAKTQEKYCIVMVFASKGLKLSGCLTNVKSRFSFGG